MAAALLVLGAGGVSAQLQLLRPSRPSPAAAGGSGSQDAANIRSAHHFGGAPSAQRTIRRVLGTPGIQAPRLLAAARGLWGDRETLPYARTLLQEATRLAPEDPNLLHHLSEIEANLGDFEAAAATQHRSNALAALPPAEGRGRLLAYLANALYERGLVGAARHLLGDPLVKDLDLAAVTRLKKSLAPGKLDWGIGYSRRDSAEPGVRVTSIVAGSPGAVAGFRVGDVVTKLGHERVADWKDFERVAREAEAGARLRCMVKREGRLTFLHLDLVAHDARASAQRLNEEGAARARAGDLAGALERFLSARAQAPRDPKAWFNVGLLLHRMGNPTGALNGYLAALALGLEEPARGQVVARASELRRTLGPRGADAFPAAARRANDEGVAYARAGDHARAFFAFLAALEESPGYPNALLGAAGTERALGLGRQAIEHFESYLAVFPEAPNRREVERDIADLRAGVLVPTDPGARAAPASGGGALATLERVLSERQGPAAARTLVDNLRAGPDPEGAARAMLQALGAGSTSPGGASWGSRR